MHHQEYQLQKAVCQYLNMQYPSVLYMSDTIASVKLTMMQAVRNKEIQKKGFNTPDLIIFHPVGGYSGLFIELKTETPFNKKGKPKSSHIANQAETLSELNLRGYYSQFAWSFDMAKDIIDKYMSQ
jgi:hypothetical protein